MPNNGITILAQKLEGEPLKYDKEQLVEHIKSLTPGCYEIQVKKAKKHKTSRQVRMIFGLMISQSVAYFDDNSIGAEAFLQFLIDNDKLKGVPVDKDYLHALMYQMCPTFDKNGKRVTLSGMDTIQANQLFERFRNIMAAFGCVINDPDPDWSKNESSKT